MAFPPLCVWWPVAYTTDRLAWQICMKVNGFAKGWACLVLLECSCDPLFMQSTDHYIYTEQFVRSHRRKAFYPHLFLNRTFLPVFTELHILFSILKIILDILNVKKNDIPGGNLQPVWYRASTAEGFAVLARYWHGAGISTAYHRRGSER